MHRGEQSRARIAALTLLAMAAFAANSLLCRSALRQTTTDPASFTLLRISAGAVVLSALAAVTKNSRRPGAGSWPSAAALFCYAAGFSFAYLSLPTGTGALLLFGAVQATMILWGFARGERLRIRQTAGLMLALGGLCTLVLPGISAPPLTGSLLMISAGIAWGIYSLRGKAVIDPIRATAGNFTRAIPLAIGLAIACWPWLHIDASGVAYAVASGAIASGLGYAIWYSVLPSLKGATAASVQLSVPVLAAAGGILLLGEPLTLRFVLAGASILGGIALVVLARRRNAAA